MILQKKIKISLVASISYMFIHFVLTQCLLNAVKIQAEIVSEQYIRWIIDLNVYMHSMYIANLN